MQTLRKTRAEFGLDLAEGAEAPPPGDGEVVVRVDNAGICGSDVHAYEWTDGYGFMVPHLPVTMGHEFAGMPTDYERLVMLRPGSPGGARLGSGARRPDSASGSSIMADKPKKLSAPRELC